jgi:hypothetical protein
MYSIQHIQHTAFTASIRDYLSSPQSDDDKLTYNSSFSFERALLQNQPPAACSAC